MGRCLEQLFWIGRWGGIRIFKGKRKELHAIQCAAGVISVLLYRETCAWE